MNEVITAALELADATPAKIHGEAARNHTVQQELEKLRLRHSRRAGAAQSR